MPRPTLFDHPKFQRLVHILGMPEPHVLGHLEYLWRVGYASGNPVIGDELDVEIAAKWGGDKGAFATALVTVALVDLRNDGRYQIHDLHDNAPEYVTRRSLKETERAKIKKCASCKNAFHSTDRRSRFCSTICRQAEYRKRYGRVTDRYGRVRNSDARVTLSPSRVTDRYGTPAPAPAPTPAPVEKGVVQNTTPVDALASTAPAAAPPVTPADLLRLWNERTRPPLPKASGYSAKRLKMAKARCAERPDVAEWARVVDLIAASRYCRGESSSGWVASFDFLLRPDTALKALEGVYRAARDGPQTPAQPAPNLAENVRREQAKARGEPG